MAIERPQTDEVPTKLIHRKVSLDDEPKPIKEMGKVMDENSFNDLRIFVQEYFKTIELPSDELAPEMKLEQLALTVQRDFKFIEQGGGVATVSRQLQVYKEMNEKGFSADEIADELDCKLATSVLGLSIQQLYGYTVLFRLKHDMPHPWIEVLLPNLAKTVFIDYHIKNNVDILEVGRDIELGLHILKNNGRIHKKIIEKIHGMYPQQLEITVAGIGILDLNFLKS